MVNLIVVAASAIVIAGAALLLHKPVISLILGILVGTTYFIVATARGGGIADARITRLPGEVRKPTDPAMAIGMGLAVAGIAAPNMMSGNPALSPVIHVWYYALFVAGLLIALFNAGKAFLAARRTQLPGEGNSRNAL